jgi:outer membrane protein OmpA-like peptidoglycan-associated protein
LTIGVKPGLAAPDEYDDSQSHPLRVVAYLLHPVGWLTEWIVYRPFHFLVSATPPQEAFFGHHPHPPVLGELQPLQDYGMPKKIPMAQTASQPAPPVLLPPPETVKIVEVPVEKVVVREVPKTITVEVEKVVFPPVAFAFDSANLTDLGKGQVYLTAQRLKEKADLTIAIEGHTDSQGSDEYNQKLGLQRAQTVMNELAAQGVDRNRISTASVGEAKPLLGQNATWARAVNRRVEFQVKAIQ